MIVDLKPEQERIIQQQLSAGVFQSVDEVLSAALDRLAQGQPGANHSAVERMLEFSRTHSVRLPAGETVEDLVRTMRISE